MNTIAKKLMTAAAVAGMSITAMGTASACVMVHGRFGWYCRPVPVQVCNEQWVATDFYGDGYWTPVCTVVYR